MVRSMNKAGEEWMAGHKLDRSEAEAGRESWTWALLEQGHKQFF